MYMECASVVFSSIHVTRTSFDKVLFFFLKSQYKSVVIKIVMLTDKFIPLIVISKLFIVV